MNNSLPFVRRTARSPARRLVAALALRILMHWAKEHRKEGLPRLAVFSQDLISMEIITYGLYEREYLDLLFTWLAPSSDAMRRAIAIDIGANLGNHSLYLSRYFSRVIAIEPNPRIFSILQINSNNVDNITALNVGLSDRPLNALMQENPLNLGGSRVLDTISDPPPGSTLGIHLTTLDAIVANLNIDNIFLIKIDAEGFEARIISGGTAVLEKYKPVVLFELHESDIKNGSAEVVELLRQRDYDIFTVEKNLRLADHGALRFFGFLLRLFIGETLTIRPVVTLPARFHQMVIAVHKDFPTLACKPLMNAGSA